MFLALKDNGIVLPKSFMTVAKDFKPKFPPQKKLTFQDAASVAVRAVYDLEALQQDATIKEPWSPSAPGVVRPNSG